MLVRIAAALCALTLAPLVAEAQWKTAVLPLVGSSPETGGQYGLAIFGTRLPQDSLQMRPSSFLASAVTAIEGQQNAFAGYDRWTAGNQQRLQFAATLSRVPIPGRSAPSWALQNVSVATKQSTITVGATKSWKASTNSWRYVGVGFGWSGKTDQEYLGTCDTITCPRPRGICDCGPIVGFSDYQVVQGSVGWVRDTRDNIFAATRGRVIDASFSFRFRLDPYAIPERTGLKGLRIEWREYRSLASAGTLAARIVVSDAIGFPPLGSLTQHAPNDGRALEPDFSQLAGNARIEWRSRTALMNNRLGFAAFADSRTPSGFGYDSYIGAGLRYRLDPLTRSTIRIDYTVGPLSYKGLFVGFNEAF